MEERITKTKLSDLFFTFAKIGAFTFGGGYAMISLIDHECVEKKQWLTADELTDITAIAESTPGPVAINCATYTGYKQKGIAGAVLATLGMILPSFLLILLISFVFEKLLSCKIVVKAFAGIRIAVSLLIIQAAVKMIRRMMKKTSDRKSNTVLIVAAFFIILFRNLLGLSFSTIYLIMVSGGAGYALYALSERRGGEQHK